MISAAKYGHTNQEGRPLTAPVVSEGRDRVLREARALFIERGFAEVSMQQIADAVGMTKAALYYHFRDKEDLFAQFVAAERERLISGLTAELEGIDTFRDQLERIAHFFFATLGSDFGRMMSDVHRHVSEPVQRRIKLDDGDPTEFFRPYFERAAAAGELREIDLDLARRLFFSMLVGTIQMCLHNPTIPAPSTADAEDIVGVFLNGIAAS